MTSRAREGTVAWMPESDADRWLVQQELSAILASSHFRSSKRYPAFLRYVVEKTLDGQVDQLKERTLGIEVFDRRPDYDTNADPVVRVSAGEVRKRIAQYYHESGEDAEIHIDLPLGSYSVVFTLKPPPAREVALPEPYPVSATGQAEASEPIRFGPNAVPAMPDSPAAPPAWARSLRVPVAGLLAAVLLAIAAGFGYKALAPTPTDLLWKPVLRNPGPVLMVVGSGNLELKMPEAPDTTLYDHMIGPYHHVSVSTAVAMARLTSILQQRGSAYTVKEAQTTSLTDLRGRSVVLIGALNNPWTLRLTDPLRFHFVGGPLAHIEDRTRPQKLDWTIDFDRPYTSVSSDYAIVARYHDASTNGTVFLVAGLGPYGTEAASEFVASPQYLQQAMRQLPGGLLQTNLEMVLRTDIIAGEAGPPYLVAVATF